MMLGQHLGERLVHVLLAEHGRSIQIRSIPGHGGDVGSCLDELLRELTRAVRPEVEEDRAVTRWIEPRTLADDDWLDELIRDPSLVTTPHRLDRILSVLPRAVDDRVERELRTLPALVAVHRVVATGNGRDAVGGQLGEVAHGRMRGDVASIRERVDPRLLRRECEQRLDVVDVRVHTAVRDEAEQMRAVAAFECRPEHGVLEERAVLNRLVHAHEVLEEDAPRPNRQVADLRVAHLTGWQADGLAGRHERRVGIGPPEPVEVRRVGELDRVPGAGGSAAPAVEDDQRYEGIAVRQIAVKESSSRDAPPTSAPSTSGCASSSAALSGLTEPP